MALFPSPCSSRAVGYIFSLASLNLSFLTRADAHINRSLIIIIPPPCQIVINNMAMGTTGHPLSPLHSSHPLQVATPRTPQVAMLRRCASDPTLPTTRTQSYISPSTFFSVYSDHLQHRIPCVPNAPTIDFHSLLTLHIQRLWVAKRVEVFERLPHVR